MKRINCPDCESRGYKTQMSSVGCAHCAFENTMRAFILTFGFSKFTLDSLFRRESGFDENRNWRFDYCSSNWLMAVYNMNIAVEIDGGIWINGGHSGGLGQIEDMEKLNHAALGWKVFHFTPEQCVDGCAALWMAKNVFGIEVD